MRIESGKNPGKHEGDFVATSTLLLALPAPDGSHPIPMALTVGRVAGKAGVAVGRGGAPTV